MQRRYPYVIKVLLCRYKSVVYPALFLLTILSSVECLAQTTYTWNKTGIADWTIDVNWTPARTTPAADDILLFNNGAVTTPINVPSQTIGQLSVTNNTTVNLQGAAPATIITISGGVGDDFTVATGSATNITVAINTTTILLATGATGIVSGNMTFAADAHKLIATDAGSLIFNSPAIVTQDVGFSGNLFDNAGASGTVIFNSGSSFVQNAGSNPFALTQPASKVVFNTGSLYKMQQNGLLSFSGRTYANLEINLGTYNQSITIGSALLKVDNLTITNGILNVNITSGVNIKGNISVATGKTLTFNPATASTLTFNGTTAQSIANNGTLTFGANVPVVINNPAGVTFNSDVTFNNVVNFTSGVVTVSSPKILTFDVASSVAGVSNASYVDGRVRKFGNTAFVFPVGKFTGSFTGYVPIEISATTGPATDNFTAEYKRSSAQVYPLNNVGINHVSNVDYWVLDRAGTTAAVNVIFYWTAASSGNGSANYITDLSKLIVAHCNGTNWDNFSGLGTVTGNAIAGSITWTNVPVFSPFSLASTTIDNPLPINLNYLNATKQGNSNYLNWKVTCTNNPTATMVVERSANNSNYTAITTITADALRCQQPFDYTDNQPLAGINYYRLKMVDANGKTTYSTVIALLNKESGFDIVGLLPTLVTSNAILNVTTAQKTKMDIVITDVMGRQLQKIAYQLIAGSNQFTINLASLSAGAYQIRGYTADGVSKSIRFVKQ